jgi:predicted DNA-binding transcriptional regulator YafY
MSSTAAEQLRRVLHLIPHLADDQDHSVEEIAAQAGVSRDELLADLISISDRFDTPGGFVDGVTVVLESERVNVHANHFHRPMRLTMPELCALELGLTMLRRERTPSEQKPVDGALTRLRQAISDLPANERHEGTRWAELAASGSAEHLVLLRGAVRERQKVRLRYRAGGSTESSERTICPHSLAFAEQMWYVVASGDDNKMRFFRLDRVEEASRIGEGFEPDAGVATRMLEAGKAFMSDTTHRMTVRYSPRIARWVAEREGATLADDGTLTLEHPVADESWAIRHLLQYGPDAEVLAPAELRMLVAERLGALSGGIA